jgi:hypothetical protein
MHIHKSAHLTVHRRERIVRQVLSGQMPKAGEAATSARGPSTNGSRVIALQAWAGFVT